MIVVDTNVIAYLLIEGDDTEDAQRVLRRDPDWAAPLLWRSELRNVLWLYVRQGHMPLDLAQRTMEAGQDLMRGGEYEVDSRDVLELATKSGCTAYDCEFVALANELQVDLVTSDRELLAAFEGVAVSLTAT